MSILTKIRDPRVRDVTVTYVEVSGDLREAKVHVSVMGDEKKQDLCMHGLRSCTGFLQQKVAERIDTRYTPRLKFILDAGIKKSAEVSRILGELLPDEADEETFNEAATRHNKSIPAPPAWRDDDDGDEPVDSPDAAEEHEPN